MDRIDAEGSQLVLADGAQVTYDYLIITTGPKLAFDEIPAPAPTAPRTPSAPSTTPENLGRLPGVHQGPRPGHHRRHARSLVLWPGLRVRLHLQQDLQRRKLRNKVPLTFITAEPYIGHMGLGGVGDSKGMLESDLRNNDIKWICNAKVTKVEPGKMFVTELGEDGQVKNCTSCPSSSA